MDCELPPCGNKASRGQKKLLLKPSKDEFKALLQNETASERVHHANQIDYVKLITDEPMDVLAQYFEVFGQPGDEELEQIPQQPEPEGEPERVECIYDILGQGDRSTKRLVPLRRRKKRNSESAASKEEKGEKGGDIVTNSLEAEVLAMSAALKREEAARELEMEALLHKAKGYAIRAQAALLVMKAQAAQARPAPPAKRGLKREKKGKRGGSSGDGMRRSQPPPAPPHPTPSLTPRRAAIVISKLWRGFRGRCIVAAMLKAGLQAALRALGGGKTFKVLALAHVSASDKVGLKRAIALTSGQCLPLRELPSQEELRAYLRHVRRVRTRQHQAVESAKQQWVRNREIRQQGELQEAYRPKKVPLF